MPPPGASNSCKKMGFGKSSNSQNRNLHLQPSIKLFHIYGKMDLEKLITTNPIRDFFTATFDRLSAKPFENLVPEGVYRLHLFTIKLFLLGAAAPQTSCCPWGASSPPDPLVGPCPRTYREAPPLGLSVFFGTKILVPRSGTKILARPGMARHGNIWHGTDHKGTARKYLAWHGSTRSWHGTAQDIPVHGQSSLQTWTLAKTSEHNVLLLLGIMFPRIQNDVI